MSYDHRDSRQGGMQPAAGRRDTAGVPGKRTLTETLPAKRHESGAMVSDTEGARVGDTEGARVGDKARVETENVGGTLWAKDEQGQDLPPSIDDISQGGLGDCYAFASMAAIVHSNPNLIKSMIKDHGNGSYTVTFHGTGVFSSHEHTVTADFVKGKHGNLKERKALWPLIIEKAYAAEKGGLEKLGAGGNPGDAVDDFVNKSESRFEPGDKEPAWVLAKLAAAQTARNPTTILAPRRSDASKAKKEMQDQIPGLYFYHAYAVVGVDERGQRVKLFNPWGREHPNGDGWLDIKDVITFFLEVNINR